MILAFEKKVKNVKKRMYSFRSHLITLVFNTQLPKVSTGKLPTSNIFFSFKSRMEILMINPDGLFFGDTHPGWELNYSDH